MSVRDSDRASNVDENRSIGASSLAAAVLSGAQRSAVQYTSSEVGVVAIGDRHEIVDVELSNSSITFRKVLRQEGRCSVDALASLDSSITVD